MDPQLLLLHEPTQGVDVGSKSDIFARITAAAQNGTAVVVASAEHEDLANICTRVIVFDSGRIVGELAGAELTENNILDLCYRGARGRGVHGMVFQWRPYRIGFVPQGTEPEFLRLATKQTTIRVFRWSPHRVGYINIPAPAAIPPTPAMQRVFRWSPHRVGYIDIPAVAPAAATPQVPATQRVFRWSPHRVGYINIPAVAQAATAAPAAPHAAVPQHVFRWSPHRVGYIDPSQKLQIRPVVAREKPQETAKNFAKTADLTAFLLEHIAAEDVVFTEDGSGNVTIELRGAALQWDPEKAVCAISKFSPRST